jgi:hypothetical protein
MYQDTIPKTQDLKVESLADHVALCYIYSFLNEIDGVFADWPDITPITPETQNFIHEVERAFSKLSVYVYQLLHKAEQYEDVELPTKMPAGGKKSYSRTSSLV